MSAVQMFDAELVDAPPLLPEREFVVSYLHHETAFLFRTAKVFVHFRIVEEGEYHGLRVYRAYRAHELIGRPRKWGRFKLRQSSELYRTFVRLSGTRERPDRVSLQRFKGTLIRASVRTVIHDAKQRPLPEALQYSVLDELVSMEAGSLT